MRIALLSLALIVACSQTDRDTSKTHVAAGTVADSAHAAKADTVGTNAPGTPRATSTTAEHAPKPRPSIPTPSDGAEASARRLDPVPTTVRALYVNRWATQSRRRMAKLIAAADETEINALVLDMKDEFGLNYNSQNPEFAKNAGSATKANVVALLDTLKKHNILAIARIVVFKDSVTARVHPEWTIRRPDGSIWRDHKGLAWVNPYHHELWDYNIGVAEELVKLGFGEIQFDYIRFPEPFPSLPQQVFPDSKGQNK